MNKKKLKKLHAQPTYPGHYHSVWPVASRSLRLGRPQDQLQGVRVSKRGARTEGSKPEPVHPASEPRHHVDRVHQTRLIRTGVLTERSTSTSEI